MGRWGVKTLALLLYLAVVTWSVSVLGATHARRSISVVCSSIEGVCRAWADGFTEATGIEVESVRMSSGEALAMLSRPGVTGFDVWHGGPADLFEVAKARGLLVAQHPADASAIPEQYRDPEHHWFGTYLGILGFCSNTVVLERLGVPIPTAWGDLLDPRLVGRVSAPSDRTSGTGYTLLWTTRLRTGSTEATVEFAERLDANVLQYTTTGMAPARVAGRGEAAVGIGFTQHCLRAEAEGLGDLTISYPTDGTGYEIGAVAVLRGANDPDAAGRYLAYALTAPAQALGGQLPTRRDVSSDPRLGADAVLLASSPREAAAARADLTAAVHARVSR